jgi:hypothetical protein
MGSPRGTSAVPFAEIGDWSEVKLNIIKAYAAAYSRILTAQGRLRHVYSVLQAVGDEYKHKTGRVLEGRTWDELPALPGPARGWPPALMEREDRGDA